MRALALLVVLIAAAPALADEIGPNDHLCTVQAQERDGSQCDACMVSIQDRMNGGADPCAPLRERGWTERCSIGATHSTHVFCDRPGDFVAIGSGSGCGCRVARPAPAAWPLAALVLVLGRRRSSMRPARCPT